LINFRYHVVSLIAVFLALAVGVVMGYGVLGQPTVDTLQRRVDTVEARANEIRAENDALRAEQARLEDSIAAAGEFAVTGRLAGLTMQPLVARGVDPDRVTSTVRLARQAGAVVPGVLWLEPKWNLGSPDDVAELAALVGVSSTSRSTVRDAGLKALATRLADGPTPGNRTDLLVGLADGGFVEAEGVDGVAYDAASATTRVASAWVVGGTASEVGWARVLVPLTRDLVTAGVGVLATDVFTETPEGPTRGQDLVAIVRDPVLGAKVTTVDDLDRVDGGLAVVLGFAERGRGTIGHYGSGEGATALLPAWWAV